MRDLEKDLPTRMKIHEDGRKGRNNNMKSKHYIDDRPNRKAAQDRKCVSIVANQHTIMKIAGFKTENFPYKEESTRSVRKRLCLEKRRS